MIRIHFLGRNLVSIRHKFGLRGKLSILIFFVVLALSAAITFYTSSYLASVIQEDYRHRAESIAGFVEAGFLDADSPAFDEHIQAEIESLSRSNDEISKISIYASSATAGTATPAEDPSYFVIASTDSDSRNKAAEAFDIQPIINNETTFVEEDESGETGGVESGETGGDTESGEERTIEMLAPLHDANGNAIASISVYLDAGPRDSLIRSQQIRFALITNLALLIMLAVIYLAMNRMLIRPIKKLTAAAREISTQDNLQPLRLDRDDEIGDLASAFDDMAITLNARDEEVQLLLEASVAVSSALKVEKILQILCEKIATSQRVTYCRISLLDDDSSSLIVKAASPTRHFPEWSRGIGDSLDLTKALHHANVLASRKPCVLRHNGQLSVKGSEAEWEWALTNDTKSALLLPLVSKNEAIGVVTLGEVRNWDRTPISTKKIEFYQTLMNQAAVAIENAQLYEKTEGHVKELSAMHRISQAFTSTLDYQEVVSVVAKRVGTLIGAQFASVLLPDEEDRHLNIVASYNLSAEYVWTINRKRRIPIGFGPIGMAFTEKRSFAVNNVISDDTYAQWKHVASIQGYSSLVALPLLAKGQSIGVICIYFAEPRELKNNEMNLLTTAANEAAIAIENSRMYENLQDAFVGTIRSLAETIDAKDTYTRGHSERVSLYAEAIARGLGLQGAELQTIRYSGYLHDVGKIGIPDAILSKPGKLTVEEFNIIKKHPVLSEKILTPVNFPFPVQSIVRHHHERYDGKGYPDGLAGEENPLGARILFVADAYEAMTSDRPYRKALSTQMALGELERNTGSQFDSRVVDVFTRIIRSESSTQREARMGA